ncbi:hypothetical protein Bbelb_279300, partial [Branchiostoma belcheri]
SCSFEDLSCTWTNSRDTACREEDIEQEWRLRSYGVDHQWFSGPPADKTYESGYYSLGCWRDESNRAIPSLEGSDSRLDGYYRSRQNPIQKCHDVAVSRGFKVFALHYSGECLSGPNAESTYMMYGRSTGCSSNGEGGWRANHVYKIVNGQYLYAGSHYVGHPQYQIHATLENAAEPDSTICGLSFYYFLGSDSSNHPVSLSVTTGNRSDYNRSDIFSVTAVRSSDWQLATIAIDESQNVSSVAIVARYWKGQRTSVSMDELRTFYCRQNIQSTVITETVVENNKKSGIVYKGEDGALNVENCKIVDNGMGTADTAESTHAVSLTLMKTSLTFKNNYVAHNQKGGVNVNILTGTNWLTKSRTVNHSLLNNFISYNNQSEALAIQGNDDDDDLSVQLRGNTISHNCPEDTKSVLNIENAGGRVYRNTLYNNTGLHAVRWTKTVSNETSVFHGNRVLYNSGQSPSARISVVTSSGINYHSNRFVNPANSFEMGSTDRTQTSSVINATMNWWGSVDQEVIRRRIRDDDVQPGLTDIDFIPFLTNLPLVTSIGGCPSDWYASTFGCYMFVVGSLDWQEAQQVCIANGAQVATFASLEEVSDVVTNLIFEAGDRGEVQKIWIGRGGLPAVVTEAPGPNEELLTVAIDDPQEASSDMGRQSSTVVVLISDIPNESTVTIETAVAETQSRRNPFICKKELVVRCPFACFHRGQCVGRTCICNKGWEGEACAEFHCRDVNNCGAFGTCVGPNNCRCKFGWQGRACSVSYCNRFDTCRACARETGCGWCDSSQQCLPGTGSGPDTASCPAWFYYGCLSAGVTETCSGHIQKIDCERRQCNESLPSSNIATCSKCLDSQYCYYQPDALGCHGWNETRCPHGEVSPDYGDTSRINRVQWRDNVRPIDPNVTTLFLCQVTLAEEFGEQAVLIVAPTPLDFTVGNVVISGQAGGIMHRVQDIGLAGAYAFVVGIPAALEEAVAYSDFRQNVELRSIEDSVTVEDIPDEDLLTSALNGSLAVNVTVKNIPEGVAVYKCVGNVYNTNEEDDEWKSEFLVMNSSQYSELRVGDFIASTETSGWMETVQDVTESPTLLFVTTTLARCGDDVPSKPRLSVFNTTQEVYLGPDTSCIGGDNNPALLIYNTSRDSFEVGKIIIGRPSGPVLSKVISLTDSDGLVYVEVRAVSTVDDFSSESDGDNTTTSRKRRATIGDAIRGARVNVARRTNVERSGSGTLKVTPYVTLDQGLELSLEVGLDYPFVQSASVRLFGSASIGLEIRFDFEGSATVSWPKDQNKPYRKGVAKRKFCIPVTPLFCLPGRILYEVYVSVVATASVKGFVSVDFGMSGSAAMGATWRHSGGVTLERDLQLQPPRPTYDGKLEEATASITGTLTPKLIVQIPSPALPINIPRWIRRFLPRSIQRLLTPGQSTGRSVVSVIVATVDLPVVAEVSAEACSNSCPVPEEPLKLAARVGVGEEPPCCICDDGKPGKQDPETDECLCECFCDPPDNTVMGLKPKSGGECDCERCPDNSLKRKTGDIECPCTCDDGQEREMEEDGSCPCECECADGSTDTIAADGSCPCRCTCKDCSESVLGPDGCICPNDNTFESRPSVTFATHQFCLPLFFSYQCQKTYMDLTAARPNCKSRSAPYHTPHGSRRATDRAPDGSLTETGRKIRRTLGVMTPAGVYAEDMPNGRRFKCDLSIRVTADPYRGRCAGSGQDACTELPDDLVTLKRYLKTVVIVGRALGGLGGCPICEDGSEPISVNCECQCEEPDPDCGEPPACAVGRKGPGCGQPDCEPCQGCSGNGVCSPVGQSCASSCRCNPQWMGTCCDIRRPRRAGGDPHMETVDGTTYDYYGIGEFWDCKSRVNDFGIQVRYFLYERASFTGAAAIKAGENVVTVTTPTYGAAQDLPTVRLDGIALSLSDSNQYRLGNGSVLMDIQRPAVNLTTGGGVLLLSFQYSSGLTVTLDVQYAKAVGRQFINVLYTPTVDFLHATEGLCGFMDDNVENDFCGPDGTIYLDPVLFAESWRISKSHDAGGLYGSWSWNISNFHASDVMDRSYTDPTHVPIYSIDGLPKEQILLATKLCEGLGISGNLLAGCIYDVSVTNDSTLLEQESLKTGSCGNCSFGECVAGFCECVLGWEGEACDQKATCDNVNNCTSPAHGACKTTDVCECTPGFIEIDCSVQATCLAVANCSTRGVCVDWDTCRCDRGWGGESCSQPTCTDLDRCSGISLTHIYAHIPGTLKTCLPQIALLSVTPGLVHYALRGGVYCRGTCVEYDVCECEQGWTGVSCALPDCSGVGDCSRRGECVGPDVCECYSGFRGQNCSLSLNCTELDDCNGQGLCVFTPGGQSNFSCRCYSGFTGTNCSDVSCSGVNDCSGNGQCVEPNLCSCDAGFTGPSCANFSCEARDFCSGHGQCVAYDECECDDSWSGPSCSIANCSDVNDCSSNGVCLLPNTCECASGYDGPSCDQFSAPNENAPVFANETFVVSVRENAPVGTKIGKVSADDADTGRNGYVTYSISPGSDADMFLVDGETGEISTIVPLDYETLAEKTISLVVVARDKGVPSLSASAAVEVAVLDTNDHCPTFQEDSTSIQHTLRPGQSLTITATDRDSGVNGQVMYSILGEGNNNRYSINESTGVITLRDDITPGRYTFVVVAIDQAAVPCSSRLTVTVIVEEEGIPVPEQLASSGCIEYSPNTNLHDANATTHSCSFSDDKNRYSYVFIGYIIARKIADFAATIADNIHGQQCTPYPIHRGSSICHIYKRIIAHTGVIRTTADYTLSNYLSVQVSPITVTVTAVESLPVPVRETVKVTAVESIPVRETVTVTAVESIPVRETVTVTAVESIPVRETVKVTAVESVPVRETVTVTAVQSIPLRETIKVTAVESPVCETVTVTAVQSIPARETVKVTAVESIPVRQLVTVTAVESMPVRETVTVTESIPVRETVTVKSTPVCETVTVTAVESIPVRQPVTVTAAASIRVRETVTVTESVPVRETVTVTESAPVRQTVTVTAVESIPVRETVLSTVQSCASTISPSRPTMTRAPQPTPVPMLTSPTSTTESPTAGSEFLLRNVDMSMVLDEAWDEDLASQSTEKYKRRSEGSTIADFQLLHNGGENFDNVATSMLRQATRNGLQVGGAKVTQLEQKDEETSDTSQAFDTRWLGLLGIFPVIILIAIAVAIQTQKKREKKRMAKRKARKQTWPYVRNMNSLRTL